MIMIIEKHKLHIYTNSLGCKYVIMNQTRDRRLFNDIVGSYRIFE